MKFKLKAWVVYLLGFPVVYGIGLIITDHFGSLSLVGEYLLWGTVGLGAYYLGHRLWFGKQKNQSKQDNL
jgi:hypothetical protein